jgi:hypothetical protein
MPIITLDSETIREARKAALRALARQQGLLRTAMNVYEDSGSDNEAAKDAIADINYITEDIMKLEVALEAMRECELKLLQNAGAASA